MADRTDLSNILVNFLKKARYQRHIDEGTLEEGQFYAITDGNEQCEYGDLFGDIENQEDLYNALCSSRMFKKEICNDPRGYAILSALKEGAETGIDTYPEYNIEIPYYQSKDGVKLVDVAYKDSVDELYTLSGNDNYIIIDEINETFRLPMQDIYSQVERKTSFILRTWED